MGRRSSSATTVSPLRDTSPTDLARSVAVSDKLGTGDPDSVLFNGDVNRDGVFPDGVSGDVNGDGEFVDGSEEGMFLAVMESMCIVREHKLQYRSLPCFTFGTSEIATYKESKINATTSAPTRDSCPLMTSHTTT
jgi:hypothetical protein